DCAVDDRFPAATLLCGPEDVRIGLKISLCLLAIAALVGVVGWRSKAANNAVRVEVAHLRRNSVQALVGAVDMLMSLKETQLAARELGSAAWTERTARRRAPQQRAAGPSKAIEVGLATFDEQLDSSRRATEGALAMAEQVGNDRVSAQERNVIATWLDPIDDQIAAHRTL